jgi:hypothetical protein
LHGEWPSTGSHVRQPLPDDDVRALELMADLWSAFDRFALDGMVWWVELPSA